MAGRSSSFNVLIRLLSFFRLNYNTVALIIHFGSSEKIPHLIKMRHIPGVTELDRLVIITKLYYDVYIKNRIE